MLGLNIITIIVVKPKYPQRREGHDKQPTRKVFDFEIFKNVNYLIWMLASVVQISGFFVPVFFLPCEFEPRAKIDNALILLLRY